MCIVHRYYKVKKNFSVEKSLVCSHLIFLNMVSGPQVANPETQKLCVIHFSNLHQAQNIGA